MRPNSAQFLIALLLVAPLLAGCLERGKPTVVETSGDDDAICRANNVAAGSSEYVACRKDRDVNRNNAAARADRRQRDLGEYMLNHPDQTLNWIIRHCFVAFALAMTRMERRASSRALANLEGWGFLRSRYECMIESNRRPP